MEGCVRRIYFSVVFISICQVFAGNSFRMAPMHKDPGGDKILSRVNRQDKKEIQIDYVVPPPKFTSVSGQQGLRVNCGNSKREVSEGKPVMPYVVSKILLPLGKTVESLSLSVADSGEVSSRILLEHGSAAIRLIEGDEVRYARPDEKIYSSENVYPEKSVVLHSIQRRRGVAYALVKIYPLSYYPASGKIIYRSSFSLNIKLKDQSSERGALLTNLKNFSTLDFENPEMINSIPDNSGSGDPASGVCSSRKNYTYVIITNNELKNSNVSPNLKSLAAQRRAKGFVDTIVTVENIYQDYSGVDNPEKIRNFIKDAYNNWKTDFVLLAGDVNVVPTKFIHVIDSDVSEVATNVYYQCLDGNYNNNGNDLWGEPTDGVDGGEVDFSPDVFIGRASAETPEEMANLISKVLKYEKDKRTGDNYLTRAEFVGEKLMNLKDTVSYGKFYMDEIQYGTDLYGYSTKGFRECLDLEFSTVFKFDSDWPSDGIEQQEFMRGRINSNEIGYINHLGHSTLKKNMKMYRGQEKFLTNSNPIFHYSQGCFVGRFEEDCFGERFISENRFGMWSAVLNSHWGIGRTDNTDGASQALQRQFWDAYFGEGMRYVGECMADQREDHIHRIAADVNDPERWGYFVSNLLGVPATKFRMYEDVVEVADVNINPQRMINAGIYIAQSKLRVNYSLSKISDVDISMYTLAGKLIKRVKKANQPRGSQSLFIDIDNLSSGIYLCRLNLGNSEFSKKIIIQ